MQIDLSTLLTPEDTVAVAVSGGSDSVALLHYMLKASKKFSFKVIALNVEHGIRGKDSVNDSLFVKNLCEKWGVELISYAVDSVKKAKEEKLSLEESARTLRYGCFYDAINQGLCSKVATAHHKSDSVETVLFNLFRGASLSGVTGIPQVKDKIIRPFLSVSKEEIENYIKDNNLPFVTDQTNFDDSYTRNYIRLNILPEIKKVFPEVESSVYRFSQTANLDNDYLDQVSSSAVNIDGAVAKINLPLHPAILSRAAVKALKLLGVKKDWEKAHIDAVLSLANSKNGAKIDLKGGVVAAKEYDALAFFVEHGKNLEQKKFSLGETNLGGKTVLIEKVSTPNNLKDGFYADLEKIPESAVIRFKRDGDLFTKFGRGTKPLGEYLTDIKIPLRERDFIPVIADGNDILAVVGVAISQKIKVDSNTKRVIKIHYPKRHKGECVMEKWIWLPNNLYPNHQTTAYSAFCANDDTPYTVAEFKKEYSFNKKITEAKLCFSADTLFVLYLNGEVLATGPAAVGGDYMLNDKARKNFFAYEKTVCPNSSTLNFLSRVQMRPTQLCDYSKGHGGFMLFASLTFEDGSKQTISTNKTWLVRKVGAYSTPSLFDGRIAPDEFIFAQEVENVWNTEIAPIPVREEYFPSVKNGKITLLPNQQVNFIAQLDKIYAGFLTVKAKGDGEVHARIICKEIDENARGENIILYKNQDYRGFYTYSAANIVVSAENRSDTQTELEVGFIATNYPTPMEATTTTDDEALNQVIKTCAHTLKICRQSLHLDSPRHCEPLACTGDYFIQSLMTPFSFGDMRLAEFDIIRTAQTLEEQDGKLFHTTYSLIWVEMLWSVYNFTGNYKLLTDCEKALALLLKRFKSYLGENGLIENPPNFMFVDWIIIDGFNLHHPPKALGQTAMNLFYYGALECAEKIYSAIEKPDLANACKSERERLKRAINSLLFDEEKGYYFEGLPTPTKKELICKFMPENTDERYYLKQSNILAVYFGVCDGDAATAIIDGIMNGEIKGDCQPYFMHFLLQAIQRVCLQEKYTLKVLNEWKAPVLECPIGLAEGFYPQAPNRRFDHSHAWGGTPVYSLPLALTGLEILEPGMKKLKLSPSLLGLEKATVEFFTPSGKVSVYQERGKTPKVSLPKGIKLDKTTDIAVEII